MTRSQAWFVHVANLLVAGTGVLWAWMLLVVEPVDDFALQNHPLQDETQAAHVLTAPLLLVALGIAWAVHVAPYLASGARARRRTGLALVSLAVPLCASGYLLQVSTDESWRALWSWLHLGTGAAWVVGYLVHQFTPRTAHRREPDPGRSPAPTDT